MNKFNSSKPHIAIYGKCNSGKSSLMNILIGSNISIISDKAGTTTDAVKRNVEISSVGGVVVYDTAGIDDTTPLGKQRQESTINTLQLIDLAILVTTSSELDKIEIDFIKQLDVLSIPYITIRNNFAETNSNEGFNFKTPHTSDRNTFFELIKNALPSDSYLPERIFDNSVKCGD
ncbi:MAG: GTPase, partial [Rikenellaceae bacterium]